ncbi:MAG TPA: Gfo/Idh/MocA family oxidoreductase [Victivallales bacterium]|nr:Gfo/Idh/MocA family oxidoreductase [Victivallales bacterium]HPO90616.1 Gfo/Idh/MocA family oxidoreductase [Victivallales bacterium]HRR28622.1 Gfo/Idh/MocA family oxidoreductase [Victivallales bacterium]HRU00764.1 Gfo/Idh/MocA family oxidoreductase [Victivallales bacterium]
MNKKFNVGLVGCGNISGAYLKAAQTFKDLIEISVCSDINMKAAEMKAKEFNLKAVPPKELYSDKSIDIILNLTLPASHSEVNKIALESGKHVHCEKPFALNITDANDVLNTAKKKNLRVGSAPDTFLGGGLQTCRKIIDDGWIGKPIAGTAFMMCHGHESWHPNAGFYYLKGGGPMLDMGPYYLTALVHLLGPIQSIMAFTEMTFKERVAICKELYGRKLPVEVQTHQAGVIKFLNGAIINIIMSFDVWKHSHNPIEIYGTEGSIQIPDPNTFGGQPKLSVKNGEWKDIPLSHGYTENMRIIGLADMAAAIIQNRQHRCNGTMATHVLEAMLAFEESSKNMKAVTLKSTCQQPAPLPIGLFNGELD